MRKGDSPVGRDGFGSENASYVNKQGGSGGTKYWM